MPRFKSTTQCASNGISVHSFIKWIPNESDSLSELVYLLKSQTSLTAWQEIVSKLEADLCEIIDSTESIILVPVPGSTTSYHTQHFTKSIRQLTGSISRNLLKHSKLTKPQKTKSFHERQSAEFEICEEFTSELSGTDRIILIDDIITTGSTILNASEAIQTHFIKYSGNKIRVEAITLFSREKQILSLVDGQ